MKRRDGENGRSEGSEEEGSKRKVRKMMKRKTARNFKEGNKTAEEISPGRKEERC